MNPAILAAAALSSAANAQLLDWTHFAGAPDRAASARGPAPSSFPSPAIISPGATSFLGASGGVLLRRHAFFLARVNSVHSLVCIDARTRLVHWASPVQPPFLDSWSAPVIDARNRAVLVASGTSLACFDAVSGALRWTSPLVRPVVNASPLVTTDLGGQNRAFITDYDPFGSSGSLYCINVDPFDPLRNPFLPGDLVWSVTLGATSGNSPAYADATLFVAAISDGSAFGGPGIIQAFDARALSPPSPLWTFTNPAGHGFYSPVSFREGVVHAASYSFFGGLFNSNLVRLEASTGALLSSTPCGRSATAPVPLADGRVLLSAGLDGFGSIPTLQCFAPDGSLLWDTALDTWIDLNANLVIDPGEYLRVGGWTLQPAAFASHALAGTLPPGGSLSAPATDLYLLDLARFPSHPDFIASHLPGAGTSPTVAWDGILTLGQAGLHALGLFRDDDVNQDGRVDLEDLFAWEQGLGSRDIDGNGIVNADDRALLLARFASPIEDQPR